MPDRRGSAPLQTTRAPSRRPLAPQQRARASSARTAMVRPHRGFGRLVRQAFDPIDFLRMACGVLTCLSKSQPLISFPRGITHGPKHPYFTIARCPRARCDRRGRRMGTDRRAGGRASGRARTRTGLDADRQFRPLQRIHLSRNHADRRQACRAGWIRPRAFERLLRRHLGVEHQLAGRTRASTTAAAWSGTSTAATSTTSTIRTGSTTSAAATTTTTRAADPGVTNADTLELYGAIGWKWVSAKVSYSTTNYFGDAGRPQQRSYYVDLSATYPIADSGVSLIGHYGTSTCSTNGSGDSKAGYSDWKLGVSTCSRRRRQASGDRRLLHRQRREEPFYTDLTGYDTSKDAASST